MSQYLERELADIQNGRVIEIDEKTFAPAYMMAQLEGKDKNTNYQDYAVSNIQSKTPLSNLYFSAKNIENIQNQIRYSIYNLSKGKYTIGPQSELALKVIMRAYYLQYGKFLNTHIKDQIKELNQLVVQYCVPSIMSEIEQYNTYIYDVEHLPMPMARSLNVSSAGTRNLKSQTSSF